MKRIATPSLSKLSVDAGQAVAVLNNLLEPEFKAAIAACHRNARLPAAATCPTREKSQD